ncbi:hypothetical protein CROQUDRAFT_632369 [Cronartium quercuum f. sp. fusiforme G11]|uniref:DUF1682-domain-containing protein n=1 Tax=Cronartium quercuum f. sp. fusiforme G11 TaxID=708437 RepID=A0A9P6NPK3_9BASI|nr:hypothetical protein CROQUDRAFT_632369 [Cronartium quercuum f. sp. fusiforme G11]
MTFRLVLSLVTFGYLGTWWVGPGAGLAGTTAVASEQVPLPQPATPPRAPSFDQSEDDTQSTPGLPSPATAPQPGSDSAKIRWPNQVPPVPPPFPPPPYEGLEYRYNRFVFRPAQYIPDSFMLLLFVLYISLSYAGKRANKKIVANYWNTVLPRLTTEFAQVGVDRSKPYVRSGPASFLAYATGRQACESLSLKFALRPRQDLAMTAYEFLRSSIDFNWTGNLDRLEWVWKMSPSKSSADKSNAFGAKDLFVWALVEKSVMDDLRKERWDVRTFTEVKESSLLPSNLVIMSESGDLTDQMLKSTSLVERLKSNPDIVKWFDSLIISGTPGTEPPASQLLTISTPKTRTITLRLRLPPQSETAAHLALLDLAFTLLDSAHLFTINVLAAQKLAKRRSEWASQALSEVRREAEREREEERRRKLKEIQDEKVGKMSASEQKKFDEKERRRKAMKMSKTAVKRK